MMSQETDVWKGIDTYFFSKPLLPSQDWHVQIPMPTLNLQSFLQQSNIVYKQNMVIKGR